MQRQLPLHLSLRCLYFAYTKSLYCFLPMHISFESFSFCDLALHSNMNLSSQLVPDQHNFFLCSISTFFSYTPYQFLLPCTGIVQLTQSPALDRLQKVVDLETTPCDPGQSTRLLFIASFCKLLLPSRPYRH